MTAEIREIIISIKDKTTRLNAAYQNVKQKNVELSEKNEKLAHENNELKTKIKNYES